MWPFVASNRSGRSATFGQPLRQRGWSELGRHRLGRLTLLARTSWVLECQGSFLRQDEAALALCAECLTSLTQAGTVQTGKVSTSQIAFSICGSSLVEAFGNN